MAATRDEAGRASAYVASDKPLFAARSIPKKYFTKAAKPEGRAESPPASRVHRRELSEESTASPPSAVTIRGAYERAVMEEEKMIRGGSPVDGAGSAGEGSPSPAPRIRDGASRGEGNNGSMSRLSGSPSRRNSAAVSNRGIEEDITSGSGSGDSVSGSLRSLWEDGTDDELDIKIKDHERDQGRANTLLKSQKGLFTRGNVGSRVTETAQTLVKKTSASSLENEPGARIPKTWGSKSKIAGGGWLSRKLFSPDSSGEVNGIPPAVVPEASVDWTGAAADIPLPSIEDGLSIQEPTPPHSRPSSAQPVVTSSQKSQIWDVDLDFTARSLQISTSPQLKIRSGKLDDIRTREMESLNKRAVATSRLEEIKERVSQDRSEPPEIIKVATREGIAQAPLSAGLEDRKFGLGASSETPEFESVHMKDGHVMSLNTPREQVSMLKAGKKAAHEVPDTPPANSRGKAQLQERTGLDWKNNPTECDPKSTPDLQEISRKGVGEKSAEQLIKVSFDQQEYFHEMTILEEEGERIHDTPITIFKNAVKKDAKGLPLEPKHEDSWEILHRLSKIASPSPGPAGREVPSDESLKQSDILHVDAKRISIASTPPKSDVDPEERIAAEASLFELADNRSERNSLRAPSPVDEVGVDETPRLKADPLTLPTPVVTGAYIDTPAPVGRRSRITREISPPSDWSDTTNEVKPRLTARESSQPSTNRTHSRSTAVAGRSKDKVITASSPNKATKTLEPKPRPLSRTPINTAKPASARDDLRRIQQESQVEDSTLDNLDQLLAAEYDESDPNSTTIIEQPNDILKDANSLPLAQKGRERLQEIRAYQRMNNTLKIASLNIRDAKRGIERLEDRVSSTPDPASQQSPSHAHHHTKCVACASSNIVCHLMIPVPRLWWRDSKKWLGIRLTWLGLIVTLFLTWVIGESITCEFICHPKYASQSNWSVRDPFWGGALPTLIDRRTAGIISFAGRTFWGLLVWIWGVWTGGGVGDLGSPRAGSAYKVSIGGMEWDGRAWSEGSIFEDETI